MEKTKGQGVNVIVSEPESKNGNGQTIGWLKIQKKNCNGDKGNNEECWSIES